MEIDGKEIGLEDMLKTVELIKVESSNISGIGYSNKYQILQVIFSNKSSYVYLNVDPNIYHSIMRSESKGRALNENIIRHKNLYKYVKLY